ncbi:hypothetical protein IAT38_002922 [Cryptococcus sp. DSM 104549]
MDSIDIISQRIDAEGVINLLPGTDYSQSPDVFQYLQLVGQALKKTGPAIDVAEEGRRYLQECMEQGRGLFVPVQHSRRVTPRRPIRYDQRTALQRPPYTADDWVALLTTHLDAIGDTAKFPWEEVYRDEPSKVTLFRDAQKDSVLRGLGWGLDWGVNMDIFFSEDSRLLLTNIRSPIPQLEEPIPPLHSAEYQRLISSIYHETGHPLTCAFTMPSYGPKAVLSLRNVNLGFLGWPAVSLPRPLSEGPTSHRGRAGMSRRKSVTDEDYESVTSEVDDGMTDEENGGMMSEDDETDEEDE